LERSLENASELVLVLNQVVQDVAEQAVEDDEGGVNLGLLVARDEGEELVE
jgi:hypothetical protein